VLATAGALSCFGLERRAALWQAGALAVLDDGVIPGAEVTPPAPQLAPMTAIEQTFADLWATGTSGTHPVQHLRAHLNARGAVPAARIRQLADQQPVTIGALVTHRQRPPTAKGTCFLALEDETGLANVIVPPWIWDRYAHTVVDHAGLLITGHIERADGAVNVIAHRLQPLTFATPHRARHHHR
jgi:error-prone DNA polymerase